MNVCQQLRELEEIIIYEDGRMMKKNTNIPVKAKLLGLGIIDRYSGDIYNRVPSKANAYAIGQPDHMHQKELPIAYLLKEK